MTTRVAPLDVFGEIAARACPLWGRAADPHGVRPMDASPAARALDEWRGLVAAGDHERFTRRLAWDALTPDTAAALACCESSADADGPWAEVLRSTYGMSAESVQAAFAATDDDDLLDPDDPLPFEELFVPLVGYAWTRVEATAPV